MPTYRLSLLLLLIATNGYAAQEPFPLGELSVEGIYATRVGDPSGYCLLGANVCLSKLPHNPWTQDSWINDWLTAYPNARVVPMSEQGTALLRHAAAARHVYVWIEDGSDSLNVSLIREGRYAATAMIDMEEAAQRSVDVSDADTRQQLEWERAQVPEENRPHRLITNSDYADNAASSARRTRRKT